MKATIRKWGKGAAVRIPTEILAAAGLDIDQPVDIRSHGGRIIIEARHSKEYVLEDLLAEITPENLHDAENL